MKINWEEIRKNQFPALRDRTHMKAAGGSPMCKSAYNMGKLYFDNIYKKGDLFWEDYFREMQEARRLMAEYLNCAIEEIAFLFNTSSGIHVISQLLDQTSLLYPDAEFPTKILPFKLKNFHCVKIKSKDNVFRIEDIENLIDLNNNLNCLIHSYVQFLTGFKQNLKMIGRITHNNNIVNIINATQAFGALPLDVKEQKIDILVASGLKWACCGYGIGILYIKKKILRDKKLPCLSWLSVKDPFRMDNMNTDIIKKTKAMDGFGGTPNFPAILALKGSLELVKKIGGDNINIGIQEIYNRIKSLTNEFIEAIQELGYKIITPTEPKYRSGIITVENRNAKEIFKELLKNNIFISLRNYPKSQRKELLRFSIHYYNTSIDIKKVISVLERLR